MIRLAFLFFFVTGLATAQAPEPANGVLLVAKPGLSDPNFSETVVLVTQTAEAQTLGVILNRPTTLKLATLLGDPARAQKYKDVVYAGGPVMRRTLVALLRATEQPPAPAFHVLRNVYLTMHPDNLEALLAAPRARYRLYAGFSGWAPRQLQAELDRGGWFVLPATEELVFRRDTRAMWRELVEKARTRAVHFVHP